MVITRFKNASPDMILTAFDGKFHEKKDEIPPKACRPSKKLKKQCRASGPQKVRKKTMSKKWTPEKSEKNNVEKVDSYTFTYFHMPSYTFKNLHIPSYTSK